MPRNDFGQSYEYSDTILYVGNLSLSVNEEELYKLFFEYKVIATAIGRSCTSLQSKGYGFVKFENNHEMINAILNKTGYQSDGKELILYPSYYSPTLYFLNSIVEDGLSLLSAYNIPYVAQPLFTAPANSPVLFDDLKIKSLNELDLWKKTKFKKTVHKISNPNEIDLCHPDNDLLNYKWEELNKRKLTKLEESVDSVSLAMHGVRIDI